MTRQIVARYRYSRLRSGSPSAELVEDDITVLHKFAHPLSEIGIVVHIGHPATYYPKVIPPNNNPLGWGRFHPSPNEVP
jgi:hypothetical protein